MRRKFFKGVLTLGILAGVFSSFAQGQFSGHIIYDDNNIDVTVGSSDRIVTRGGFQYLYETTSGNHVLGRIVGVGPTNIDPLNSSFIVETWQINDAGTVIAGTLERTQSSTFSLGGYPYSAFLRGLDYFFQKDNGDHIIGVTKQSYSLQCQQPNCPPVNYATTYLIAFDEAGGTTGIITNFSAGAGVGVTMYAMRYFYEADNGRHWLGNQQPLFYGDPGEDSGAALLVELNNNGGYSGSDYLDDEIGAYSGSELSTEGFTYAMRKQNGNRIFITDKPGLNYQDDSLIIFETEDGDEDIVSYVEHTGLLSSSGSMGVVNFQFLFKDSTTGYSWFGYNGGSGGKKFALDVNGELVPGSFGVFITGYDFGYLFEDTSGQHWIYQRGSVVNNVDVELFAIDSSFNIISGTEQTISPSNFSGIPANENIMDIRLMYVDAAGKAILGADVVGGATPNGIYGGLEEGRSIIWNSGIVVNTCGDGVFQSSTEECDDGGNGNGDGCSDQCLCETGYSPDGSGNCVAGVVCGSASGEYYTQESTNPLIFNTSREYCSDGSAPSNFTSTNGIYNRDCLDETSCQVDNLFCGNGVVDSPHEECDGSPYCTLCECAPGFYSNNGVCTEYAQCSETTCTQNSDCAESESCDLVTNTCVIVDPLPTIPCTITDGSGTKVGSGSGGSTKTELDGSGGISFGGGDGGDGDDGRGDGGDGDGGGGDTGGAGGNGNYVYECPENYACISENEVNDPFCHEIECGGFGTCGDGQLSTDTSGICDNVPNNSCTTNQECEVYSCNGGNNDGNSCAIDGTCEVSSCNGGVNNGAACNSDTDCQSTCNGGINNGTSCTDDGDCTGSSGGCVYYNNLGNPLSPNPFGSCNTAVDCPDVFRCINANKICDEPGQPDSQCGVHTWHCSANTGAACDPSNPNNCNNGVYGTCTLPSYYGCGNVPRSGTCEGGIPDGTCGGTAGTCDVDASQSGTCDVDTGQSGTCVLSDVEECDDGNNTNGDGCDYQCQCEPGYYPDGTGGCEMVSCGDNFYDDGGLSGLYSNDHIEERTICPDSAGAIVSLEFNSFSLESNSTCSADSLSIYSGENETGTLEGTFCGNANPGIITSQDTSGCLHVVFESDSSLNFAGWDASVTCSTLGGDGECFVYVDTYETQPATDTLSACVVGDYFDVDDSAANRRRDCEGSNGGLNVHCAAEKAYCGDGVCSPTAGENCTTCSDCGSCLTPLCTEYTAPTTTQPASDTLTGCQDSLMTYADVPDTAIARRWSCQSNNGVTTVVCESPKDLGLCGNGIVDLGEECDDNDSNDNDECTNACRIARCGDGIVETGVEECDRVDGCSNICEWISPSCTISPSTTQTLLGGTISFNLSYTEQVVGASEFECGGGTICGDGFVDYDGTDNILGNVDDEECDDGNNASNDGCSATCKHDTPTGTSSVITNQCFNGVQDGTETGIDCGGICQIC